MSQNTKEVDNLTDLNDFEKELEFLGFQRCKFSSDDQECDICAKTFEQLYYRRTDYFSEEGEYFCESCVKKYYKLLKQEIAYYDQFSKIIRKAYEENDVTIIRSFNPDSEFPFLDKIKTNAN